MGYSHGVAEELDRTEATEHTPAHKQSVHDDSAQIILPTWGVFSDRPLGKPLGAPIWLHLGPDSVPRPLGLSLNHSAAIQLSHNGKKKKCDAVKRHLPRLPAAAINPGSAFMPCRH